MNEKEARTALQNVIRDIDNESGIGGQPPLTVDEHIKAIREEGEGVWDDDVAQRYVENLETSTWDTTTTDETSPDSTLTHEEEAKLGHRNP